jgi:hypothetical protein
LLLQASGSPVRIRCRGWMLKRNAGWGYWRCPSGRFACRPIRSPLEGEGSVSAATMTFASAVDSMRRSRPSFAWAPGGQIPFIPCDATGVAGWGVMREARMRPVSSGAVGHPTSPAATSSSPWDVTIPPGRPVAAPLLRFCYPSAPAGHVAGTGADEIERPCGLGRRGARSGHPITGASGLAGSRTMSRFGDWVDDRLNPLPEDDAGPISHPCGFTRDGRGLSIKAIVLLPARTIRGACAVTIPVRAAFRSPRVPSWLGRGLPPRQRSWAFPFAGLVLSAGAAMFPSPRAHLPFASRHPTGDFNR